VAEPYLREVLRATRPLTGKSPVVFAGVEYLHSIAAAMASGMRLTPRFISGNPDVMTASQLHAHAVEIMKPHYEEAVNADLERFNHVAGTGKTSTEPSEVAMRAYHGMVDTLFVDGTIEIWGKIDPDVQEVQIHDQHEAKDQDILDFAAVHTVLNGGTVHVLERSRMPEGRPLAALFRY